MRDRRAGSSKLQSVFVLIEIRNARFDAKVVFGSFVVVRIEPGFLEGDAFALVSGNVGHERDDGVPQRDARVATRLDRGVGAIRIFLDAPRPVFDLLFVAAADGGTGGTGGGDGLLRGRARLGVKSGGAGGLLFDLARGRTAKKLRILFAFKNDRTLRTEDDFAVAAENVPQAFLGRN